MLVLSRKEGQAIRVGDVLVTVTRMDGNRVLLGIQAPREVPIIRAEKDGPKLDTEIFEELLTEKS